MIRVLTALAGIAIAAVAAAGLTLAGERPGTPAAHAPLAETFGAAEVIRHDLGSKRAVGYFVAVDGGCRVTLVVAEVTLPAPAQDQPARLTISLRPGEQTEVVGAAGERLTLSCGPEAKTMQVVRAASPRS